MSDVDKVRCVLVLGKFRVIERGETNMKIALGGSTTMTCHNLHPSMDVRVGDLLTFYTEVFVDDKSSQPPVQ